MALDDLAVKFCEQLPLDFTLYEKEGFCEKPNDACQYCEQYSPDLYSCNKKTYTFIGKYNHA